MKPVILVNSECYRENKMNVKIEANDYRKILRNQIDAHGLDFEHLVGYAKYSDRMKVYKGLSELSRGAE